MEKRTQEGLKKKREYIAKRNREKCVGYTFRFSKEVEQDLIDHLAKQDNKQGYIKRLIREDMAKSGQ